MQEYLTGRFWEGTVEQQNIRPSIFLSWHSFSLNWFIGAYLEGTLEDVVLEHERDGDKDKVQQEHGEAEPLVHAPIEAGDR